MISMGLRQLSVRSFALVVRLEICACAVFSHHVVATDGATQGRAIATQSLSVLDVVSVALVAAKFQTDSVGCTLVAQRCAYLSLTCVTQYYERQAAKYLTTNCTPR